MTRPLTLRARLLAGMAVVAGVFVVVVVITNTTTRERLIDQVDTRLVSLSTSQIEETRVERDRPTPPGDEGDGDRNERERISDVYEGEIGADGLLVDIYLPNAGRDGIAGAPVIDAADLPAGESAYLTVPSSTGDVTYRVYAHRLGDTTTITAVSIDDVQHTIRQLTVFAIVGSALALAVLGAVVWWMIRLGIEPIKQMTHTATRIADGDLAERVEPGAPGTEVGELSHALNSMLGHIEEAFAEREASEQRLRRFVADASHELRTPVTTIRGYAELYRLGGLDDPEALADAMRRTEQESARMGRLVEDMLTLARLDEARPLATEPVDLVRVADDAARDARATAPGRPVDVVHQGNDSVTTIGDEDRIRQIVANLVANAVVHTDDGVPITIEVGRNGDTGTIAVRDAGAGMPPDVAARVTERFFRADPARSRHRGGSGLGLSIVDATVAAMSGVLTIDSAPGAGTSVTISLPIAGTAAGGA